LAVVTKFNLRFNSDWSNWLDPFLIFFSLLGVCQVCSPFFSSD
jgi:hypothetical protein